MPELELFAPSVNSDRPAHRDTHDTEALRTEVVQLKRAMQTRPVIDMARGVLMASFGLRPDDAWSVLVDVSQHTNTKLRQVAAELVETVGGEPLPEPLSTRLSTAVADVSRAADADVSRFPRSA
ncbi:ANTAR domain-containing protein [Streptomyces aurantiacus]|uniref:ANTAR domain-containing protein n=1 Tax=Streptomyces aurantiacus TaxID=47760 RepID=UPI00099ECBCF